MLCIGQKTSYSELTLMYTFNYNVNLDNFKHFFKDIKTAPLSHLGSMLSDYQHLFKHNNFDLRGIQKLFLDADFCLSESRITRITRIDADFKSLCLLACFFLNRGLTPNQRYECHLGILWTIFVRTAEDAKSETIEWLWRKA